MGIGISIEERKRHCYNDNLFGSKKKCKLVQNKINFSDFRNCYQKNYYQSKKEKIKKIKKLKKKINLLEKQLIDN